MTNQLIKVNPNEFGLEETKANEMVSGLQPIFAEREILAAQYAEIITKEINAATIKEAKELRNRIVKNRTQGIEAWHKVNKEFYLRGGQFVDAIKRKEVAENERMEANLSDIEKHYENIEKERLDKLQIERVEAISPYVTDTTGLDFRTMQQEVFDAYLAAKKQAYFDFKAAEKAAEEERIAKELAEKAEQERIRLENEKLKKEAEEREAILKAEREKAEQERLAVEAKIQAEREKIQAEEKKKADELAKKQAEDKAKQDAILKAEQEAKAKIEAELKAKKEAEEKIEQDRLADIKRKEAEAAKLAKAGDKAQLNAWVESMLINGIGTESMKQESIDVANSIMTKFESFKSWAKQEIEKL